MSLMSTPSSLKKEVGIKFVNLTFQKAVQQAKTSNKLVFIDVHTSWCGPCKEMAATTFKDAEVGALFNKNFINLKIDAEKDADGPSVARAYGVRAYPTLLFIDGDGNVVQKVIGKQTKEKLIYIASSLKQ
jgi:thiol:disulfide interchange protein